jgi:cytochrome b
MISTETVPQRVRLWDAPTRVFHGLLLVAVVTAIVSGVVGGNWMELHGKVGLAIAGLLMFRLVWGFVGNRYARFASFFPLPSRLLNYLHGEWRGLGHNPLGALSVLAMLTLLSLQVGTGLFGTDQIAFTGPLISLVSDALSLRLTGLHRLLSNVLFVLLGLHLGAILFHTLIKKDNLIKPMLTGFKDITGHRTDDADPKPAGWVALAGALVVAVMLVCLASGVLLGKISGPTSAVPQTSTPKPAW